MVAFSSLFLAGSVIIGVFGAPRPDLGKTFSKRATATPNGEGIGSDGFFFSIWSDAGDDMTFNNGADGEYSLTWSGDGDVVCGKGWQTGSAQNITYSGTYEPDGVSFLSVYGWFTNPLTEYYILENYGTVNPDWNMDFVGNLTSDGSVYSIYKTVRENAASIEGVTTFNQYWSIREDKRVGGTINTANHFDAWNAAGLEFSGFHYQILATEGVKGSGSSNIKIAAAESADDNSRPVQSSSAAAAAPTPSAVSIIASSAASIVASSASVVSSIASSIVNPVRPSVESSAKSSAPTSTAAAATTSTAVPTLSQTSSVKSSSVTSVAAPITSSETSSKASATPAPPSSTDDVDTVTTIIATTVVTAFVTALESDAPASTAITAGTTVGAGSSFHHHHPRVSSA